MFSNKTYDILKFLALIALPAAAVLYLGLGELWGWPNTEQVAGSIVLLDTFLGGLLQISTTKYNNKVDAGYLATTGAHPDTGLPDLQLTVKKHPGDVVSHGEARFKIIDPPQ